MVEHAPHAPQLGRGLLLAEGVLLEGRREPLLHRIEDLVPERAAPALPAGGTDSSASAQSASIS